MAAKALNTRVDAGSFDRMTRDELVAKARAMGVERAELMTRVELKDEIVRREEPDPVAQRRARGWLGVARDLVAGVVESGLNLPDAAALIRGRGELDLHGPSPVATVTLAQIYAAQGHQARAIAVLDEVLAKEPDHAAARELREQFANAPTRPVESAPRRRVVFDTEGSAAEETPAPAAVLEPEPAPPASGAVEALSDAPHAPHAPGAPVEPPVPAAAPAGAAPVQVVPPRVVIARAPGMAPEAVWDLGELAKPAGAQITLRFIAWTASAGGLSEHAGELALKERRGRERLPDVEPSAVVRAALGYRHGDAFVPLVIASEIVSVNGSLRVAFRAPPGAEHEPTQAERDLLSASAAPN